MKTIVTSFIFLGLYSLTWAQSTLTLRGTITLDGESAVGVKIALVGTEIGAYSDFDGRFILSSPQEEGKIAVSLMGAVTQIIDFTSTNSNINIDLVPQALELAAVEILGYQNMLIYREPLCHPNRCCCNLVVRTIQTENIFMSDPAILNGLNSQLSIARQGDDILPRFNQAAIGSQASLCFNSMPLDQKADGLFRFLWESNPQRITALSPNDAINTQGAQSLGGNISFHSNSINQYDSDLTYQGLGGISFSSGERQADFSHQEHHFRIKRDPTDSKFKMQGGLDYVSRPNYRSDSQWQLYGGSLNTRLDLRKIHWETNLLAANMQSVGQDAIADRNQIAILSQLLQWRANDELNLKLNQLTQISHRDDKLRQYHAVRTNADYHPSQQPKLAFNAQYDFQQSEEQQNHAFAAGANYQLPKEMSVAVGLRQEQYFTQNEGQAIGATTIRASIGRNEGHCAPSRISFRYEAAALLLNQNRVWLNSLASTWEITNNGSLRLEGRLHANRFAERQAVDLCWLQWDGQGNQTQFGGSLGLTAHHRFNSGLLIYSHTSYSYNQSFIDPDPTTASRSRSGPSGGQPSVLNNELPLPKGIFRNSQTLTYKAWAFDLNAWAWLQNDPSSALANGLRLQETRLSWHAPANRIHQKLKKVKCSLQANNLLQWTDSNHQEFDQLAVRYAQDSFNPMASGRQLLLGLEVEL
ncbi:MAG: carboxypeptidase-like regulatory domain-containing protein [Bacteroidia bacterium]